MKIVFICGSLEPGRDGVGDYVLRMAAELVRQGQTVGALSLNDKFRSTALDGFQSCGEVEIPLLRLPSQTHVNDRFKQAEEWIDNFGPDWLSLQFVPFAFHPKGVPFYLSNQLISIGKNRKWHVMFHELWVGMEVNAPKKFRVLGWLQRRVIKSVIKKLRPEVIHTQTNLYQKQLERIGFKSEFLPLFSNIPVTHKINIDLTGTYNKNDQVSFVLFGSIHSNTLLKEFVEEMAIYAENTTKRIIVKFIGQCGAELDNWIATLKFRNIGVEVFGQQSPEQISHVLSTASFGISTTPVALIEKSGSFAAMREHGLQVICVSNNWHPMGFEHLSKSGSVVEYIPGNFNNCLDHKNNGTMANSVSFVCDTLVKSLNA